MTYEQLLELELKNGKVNKGLSYEFIKKMEEKEWKDKNDTTIELCSICFEKFVVGLKFKRLEKCGHEYHSRCIDKWL